MDLRDQIWQFIGVIVAIVLGLGSIVATIIIASKQQKRKEILYDIISSTSLSSFNISGKLKMTIIYGKKHLEDMDQVYLKLWNAGDTEILLKDYSTPIELKFGNKATILEALVTDAIPNPLRDKISISWDKGSVLIQPVLLNSKDAITLKVLLTQFSGEIIADARIAGVTQIKDLKETELSGIGYIASIGWGIQQTWISAREPILLFISFIVFIIIFTLLSSLFGLKTIEPIFNSIFLYFGILAMPICFTMLIYLPCIIALNKRKIRYNRFILLLISAILPIALALLTEGPFLYSLFVRK